MKITKYNFALALIVISIFASVYGLLGFECWNVKSGRSSIYCQYFYPEDTRILTSIGASMFGLGILLYKKDKKTV